MEIDMEKSAASDTLETRLREVSALAKKPALSVAEQTEAIEGLKAQLAVAKKSQDAWSRVSNRVFKEVKEPVPPADLEAFVIALHDSHKKLREDYVRMRRISREQGYKLTQKQKEIYSLSLRLKESEAKRSQETWQLRSQYVDPWINENYQRMQDELEKTQSELKRSRDEIAALTFSPQAASGRQLMAKCKQLQEENEELGRQLSEGNEKKLEQQLALQKELSKELNENVEESNRFVVQLDEELQAQETTNQHLQLKLQRYEQRFGSLPDDSDGGGGGGDGDVQDQGDAAEDDDSGGGLGVDERAGGAATEPGSSSRQYADGANEHASESAMTDA